jgi:hypothetical protein
MRSASALRFSKGCSSLNLDRMVDDVLMVLSMSVVCLQNGWRRRRRWWWWWLDLFFDEDGWLCEVDRKPK